MGDPSPNQPAAARAAENAPRPATSWRSSPPPSESPLRVLVVDDDDQIRSLLALTLLDEGLEVVTAADGAIALDRAQEYPPDVILLDMHMPVMDGWTFAREYRQAPGPHAPIVVFTAGGQAAAAAGAIGAQGFAEKPFDLDDLVNDLVRHARGAAA